MADYAHDMTDQELAALEKRIAQVYKDASAEMSDTVNDYFDSFSDRIKGQKALLDSGEITQAQYNQWMLNQIGRGENYQNLQNQLADRYTSANEVAISYVNDATPGIYSLNRNYSNYSLESLGDDISFNLWDESTVRRNIVSNPSLMPNYPESKAVKRGIDLKYGKQQITASVTSGILQGKSTSRIARDLMNRLTDMNYSSAVRAARTAFTAAENGGRQDSYEEAADMGLEVQKVWLATLDKKTRPAHQRADYQVVAYDECFEVDGEQLMYPGDAEHGASGANLYNCRCTMFRKKPGESLDNIKRWARDPETGLPEDVEGMSYDDWLKSKGGNIDNTSTNYTDRENAILDNLKNQGVEYNPVNKLDSPLSERDIINKLAGGDTTSGSCASQALAYAGNKLGFDVTDYRGGASRSFFSDYSNLLQISTLDGVESKAASRSSTSAAGNALLKQMEPDKEYILCAGKHAAVVMTDADITGAGSSHYMYLELQSNTSSQNRWHYFTEGGSTTTRTLSRRFGGSGYDYATLTDIDSLSNVSSFQEILGYINTSSSEQMKGSNGGIK